MDDWTIKPSFPDPGVKPDCPDCGVKPGELHIRGCDIERCPNTKVVQLTTCCCDKHKLDLPPEKDLYPPDEIRFKWEGDLDGPGGFNKGVKKLVQMVIMKKKDDNSSFIVTYRYGDSSTEIITEKYDDVLFALTNVLSDSKD